MRRPARKGWQRTGWRIVSPRGIIEYRCYLPCGGEGIVFRKRPGMPWRFQVGRADGAVHGRFKTAPAAMQACEGELRKALRSSLRMLA